MKILQYTLYILDFRMHEKNGFAVVPKNLSTHSEKKVVPATRNWRTNSALTMYYKVVITTMNNK